MRDTSESRTIRVSLRERDTSESRTIMARMRERYLRVEDHEGEFEGDTSESNTMRV